MYCQYSVEEYNDNVFVVKKRIFTPYTFSLQMPVISPEHSYIEEDVYIYKMSRSGPIMNQDLENELKVSQYMTKQGVNKCLISFAPKLLTITIDKKSNCCCIPHPETDEVFLIPCSQVKFLKRYENTLRYLKEVKFEVLGTVCSKRVKALFYITENFYSHVKRVCQLVNDELRPHGIIHGDLKLDNIVLNREISIIDYEYSIIFDPNVNSIEIGYDTSYTCTIYNYLKKKLTYTREFLQIFDMFLLALSTYVKMPVDNSTKKGMTHYDFLNNIYKEMAENTMSNVNHAFYDFCVIYILLHNCGFVHSIRPHSVGFKNNIIMSHVLVDDNQTRYFNASYDFIVNVITNNITVGIPENVRNSDPFKDTMCRLNAIVTTMKITNESLKPFPMLPLSDEPFLLPPPSNPELFIK